MHAIKSKHFIGYMKKDTKDRSVCFGSQTGSQGTRPGACDILGWKLHLRSELKDCSSWEDKKMQGRSQVL